MYEDMTVSEMSFSQFKEYFMALDIQCIKEFQRIITEVTGSKLNWDGGKNPNIPMNQMVYPVCTTSLLGNHTHTIATAVPLHWDAATPKEQSPKENTMRYADTACAANVSLNIDSTGQTETAKQRDYFLGRLDSVYRFKYHTDLPKLFGIDDEDQPETIAEAKARIAAGQFTLCGYRGGCDCYDFDEEEERTTKDSAPFGGILWRDPSVKRDRKGLAKAREQLENDLKDFRDQIWAKPEASYDILESFKAKTYH